MKKILLFTDSLGAGGAQRQLVGLASLLQQKGYEIKVCTYQNIDFYKFILDKNMIANELIPEADNVKKRIFAVRKYFMKEKPDWVIAYQEVPSLVACIAKLLGGEFRLLVSERNTTQYIGKNEYVRFFLYHWADAIVPNSYSQGEFLISHYPWMKKKLTTISNFVDLACFSYTTKIMRQKPLVVVAASICPHKNTLGFIEAVRLLKEKGLNFCVEWYGIIEGKNEYIEKCQRLIAKYALSSFIQFLPKSKQIQQKYRECDFFCLPSFYEGTPNVVCEAMSCGRPVICSRVCDNPVYVAEGENGFLFDPAKPETIADAIGRALELTAEEYQRLCHKSREKAERLLSEEVFVDKYIKIIES